MTGDGRAVAIGVCMTRTHEHGVPEWDGSDVASGVSRGCVRDHTCDCRPARDAVRVCCRDPLGVASEPNFAMMTTMQAHVCITHWP